MNSTLAKPISAPLRQRNSIQVAYQDLQNVHRELQSKLRNLKAGSLADEDQMVIGDLENNIKDSQALIDARLRLCGRIPF